MYAKVAEPKVTLKKSPEKKERNLKMNYFEQLNGINVSDKTEKKNGLTYLSWAWAWAEVKKKFPKSFYTVYENADGWNYFTDKNTCWVKTGVTVVTEEETIEHIEYLPVMDFKNKSIKQTEVTSFDVNKAIQRSLTKAIARHGLGLYIYSGEDLPEDASKPAIDTQADMPESERVDATKQINKIQAEAIKALAEKTNSDVAALCKHYGVASLDALNIQQWMDAKKIMEKKQK